MIDQQELGRRLRAAREAASLTQEEAAQRVGVSRAVLAQMEIGKRSVTSLELGKLAFLYGRDLNDFLEAEFREEEIITALFRAEFQALGGGRVADVTRECLALAREFTRIEGLLGVSRTGMALPSYLVPVPRSRYDAIQQGERIAEEERRRLGLGAAPVSDLIDLLETQGVRTGLASLPDDVSGLTLSGPSVGAFVVINDGHHPWRHRFSLAHEYCHVLLDRSKAGLVSRASDRDELLEVRANAFAASFLLPEVGVQQFVEAHGKGRPSRLQLEVYDESGVVEIEGREEPGSQDIQLYDLVQLAHYFQVSRLSALYRLLNLRLIKEPDFQRLKRDEEAGKGRQMARLLRHPEPPDTAPHGFSQRFILLALEAYRRDLITWKKLEELGVLARFPVRDLVALVQDPRADDEDEAAPAWLPDDLF